MDTSTTDTPPPTHTIAPPWAQRAAAAELFSLFQATEGIRNDTLNRAAFITFGLVKGGNADEGGAWRSLRRCAAGTGLPKKEIERTLRSAWLAAEPRYISTQRPADQAVERAVATLWYAAQADPDLMDRRGSTTLRIVWALLFLAQMSGDLTFTASFREIAELAGVAVGTISKHEPRWSRFVEVVAPGGPEITQSGRVGRDPDGIPNVAASYFAANFDTLDRFQARIAEEREALERRAWMGFPVPGTIADPAHDLYAPADDEGRRHADPNAWRIVCLLDRAPQRTEAELAEATGRHHRTIRRALNRLEDAGAVLRLPSGAWALAAAADEIATGLALAERRKRHADERALYAAVLEDYERTPSPTRHAPEVVPWEAVPAARHGPRPAAVANAPHEVAERGARQQQEVPV